jgi:hypothetical protein
LEIKINRQDIKGKYFFIWFVFLYVTVTDI